MNTLSQLNENKDNPIKYLFYTGIFHLVCLVFPQHIGLDIFLAVSCMLIFICRPAWGVYFIIAIHPIMSCSFDIFWTIGQPVEIISAEVMPIGSDSITPLTRPISVYPFQVAAFILLPSLVYHCRPFSRQQTSNTDRKIIYTALSFFFIWGTVVSMHASYPDKALFGLSRFLCITILISYLVRFISGTDTLRKVMVVYCCAAVSMSFLAYYSTYNGFENISLVYSAHGLNIFQRQSLFNTANKFNPEIMSMLPGFGVAGKHEFSTYIVAGFFSSAYLLLTENNKVFFLFYPLAFFTLYVTLFYAPCKVSIVGIIIGVLHITLLSPSLRKHISIIILLLIFLNIVGLAASSLTRPLHAKKMAGSTQNFQVVNSESEFDAGIMERKAIWLQTAETIRKSYGLGIGSDMYNNRLNHDNPFHFPHAHNLFLGLFAEYGFPAIICLILWGVLAARQVIPIITSHVCIQDRSTLAVVSIVTCFFALFFEYNFDCFVWLPQLWIISSLLMISVTIALNERSILT